MHHQDPTVPAHFPPLSHTRDLVWNTSDFKVTPPGKIPPVVFRRRWEALLQYTHLSEPDNLTSGNRDIIVLTHDQWRLLHHHMAPLSCRSVNFPWRLTDGTGYALYLLGLQLPDDQA